MALHHHAAPSDEPSHRRRRILARVALLLTITTVGAAVFVGYHAVGLLASWRSLERESFDEKAFAELAPVPLDTTAPSGDTADQTMDEIRSVLPAAEPADGSPSTADPTDPYDAYLIVGSDEGDQRADVIMLALLPADGSSPLLVSLPRDLYLPNRCTGGLTRLNANYNGCGPEVNGITLLAGAVTDFTGIEIDHFALFTMDGFEQIIDAIGGMEVCVEHPVREEDRIDLPAGCSTLDGADALGWVRSRKTQEFVDGSWRTMPGVDDLTRNRRQQDLLLAVMARVGEFDSPGELGSFAASLSDTFVLDDRLGLSEAAELAWSHRGLSPDELVRPTIPVRPHTTTAGAQVLLPTAPFAEVLATSRG